MFVGIVPFVDADFQLVFALSHRIKLGKSTGRSDLSKLVDKTRTGADYSSIRRIERPEDDHLSGQNLHTGIDYPIG